MSSDFPGARPSPLRRRIAIALVVVPVLATMAVPLYARAEPRLSGVPFFYWYQFGCVLLTAACLAVAHRLGDHHRPRRRAGGGGPR